VTVKPWRYVELYQYSWAVFEIRRSRRQSSKCRLVWCFSWILEHYATQYLHQNLLLPGWHLFNNVKHLTLINNSVQFVVSAGRRSGLKIVWSSLIHFGEVGSTVNIISSYISFQLTCDNKSNCKEGEFARPYLTSDWPFSKIIARAAIDSESDIRADSLCTMMFTVLPTSTKWTHHVQTVQDLIYVQRTLKAEPEAEHQRIAISAIVTSLIDTLQS